MSYAAQDESEKVNDLWNDYLRSYESKIHSWQKKNKALKEFSTVK